MTFDGTCERGGVQRPPQETEMIPPAGVPNPPPGPPRRLGAKNGKGELCTALRVRKCGSKSKSLGAGGGRGSAKGESAFFPARQGEPRAVRGQGRANRKARQAAGLRVCPCASPLPAMPATATGPACVLIRSPPNGLLVC
jgi:hypothetical protein